jgi:hypothetical protein
MQPTNLTSDPRGSTREPVLRHAPCPVLAIRVAGEFAYNVCVGIAVCKPAGNNEHDRFDCAAKSDENFLVNAVDQIEQQPSKLSNASSMAWASPR